MSFTHYADGVTIASVANLPESGNFKSPGDYFLYKKNPFAYAADVIVLKSGTAIDLYTLSNWEQFVNRGDIELSSADLDTGAFAVGTDYYVYLCYAAGATYVKISANSTFPTGLMPNTTPYSADNTRKIGGFHYGHIRKVNADWTPVDSNSVAFGATGTIWQNNVTTGIVPNSVWDLKNKPSCSPEGMVKVGNLWVDIYLASAEMAVTMQLGANSHISAGKLQSKYGKLPITGTESLNWYSFAELAQRSGKRMISYAEWVRGAMGNPGGEAAADNFGWTKTTNSARAYTGVRVNNSTGAYDGGAGIKPYAISAFNLVDCVGNVHEWLDELGPRFDNTQPPVAFAWQNVLGTDKGQAYLSAAAGLSAFIAGGNWGGGVSTGSRSVSLGNYPWDASAGVGCRLACDAA